MTLCIIIGEDSVGRHIAEGVEEAVLSRADVGNSREEAPLFIGLGSSHRWLRDFVPHAEFLAPFQIRRFEQFLVQHGVTEVKIAGGLKGIFRHSPLNPRIVAQIAMAPTLWWPHGYYKHICNLLDRHNIRLTSILDFIPELGLEAGVYGVAYEAFDSNQALEAVMRLNQTVARSGKNGWKKIEPSHIVDEGNVIESGKSRWRLGSTNGLLQKFGQSAHRKTANYPVLCKVAIPEFQYLDVPVIGGETVDNCLENGVQGIVIQARTTIVMDQSELLEKATEGSLGIYAI